MKVRTNFRYSCLILILSLSSITLAQQIHPKKSVFKDLKNWPVTSPGKVTLNNFAPFRAVYNRTYKQGGGAKAGETRKDRVIISAENTGWDGNEAISINLIDSGIADKPDTNARVLTMFVNKKDLSVLFELGPLPGTAKNYYIGRIEKEKILFSAITTDKQEIKAQSMPTNKPGFGATTWTVANMPLKKGMKISFSPNYSPPGNVLASNRYGHIVDQGKFVDASGKSYKSWIFETSRNFSTPRVSHVHLTNRPPYYLGTETVDLETGKRTRFIWLDNLTIF